MQANLYVYLTFIQIIYFFDIKHILYYNIHMKHFGILFLIAFIGCFIGAIISSIIDNRTLGIIFSLSLFGLIFIAIIIDKAIKSIKLKNVAKKGKRLTAKIAGATYGGRKEVDIGTKHQITNYFYAIFYVEDVFGNKAYYTSIKTIKDAQLQQLINKGEVSITAYKGACKIEEDFSLLPPASPVPYMGKNIILDEEGNLRVAVLETKGKNKKERPGIKIYKIATIISSIISCAFLLGSIALIVFAIISKQYSLIVFSVITLILTFLFDFKILISMINGLNVDKKGSRAYANQFTAEKINFSSQRSSDYNYVVKYSYYDQFGTLQNANEFVFDDVYFIIQNLQRLPIKVYKKSAIIDMDALPLN